MCYRGFSFREGAVKLFDCNRPTQSCANEGTCSSDTGECTCTGSYLGFACDISGTDSSDGSECSNGCNTGQCLQDGTCYCPPESTGDTCQLGTVKLTCGNDPPGDSDSMTLDVTALNGASQAQVIVKGADMAVSDDARCFGTAGQALSVVNVFSSPTETTTCRNAVKTTVNSKDVYKRDFLVRFKDGITSIETDFIVNAECGPDGPNVEITANVNTAASTDSANSLQSVARSNTVVGAAVIATLTNAGNAITSSSEFNLDAVITITLELDVTDSEFGAIDLKTFKVDNGEATDPKELELIVDYCPTVNAGLVIKTGPTKSSEVITVIEANPVVIDPTHTNKYTFEVHVCKNDNKASCTHTCGARRKRSAKYDDVAMMTVGFNVMGNTRFVNTDGQAGKHTDNEKQCAITTEITASLVAMGVAILLLLVLVIVLVVRAILTNHREISVYKHQPNEPGSVTSLPKMISSNY